MTTIYSEQQILDSVRALRPEAAMDGERIEPSLCATEIYTSVISTGGEIIELHFQGELGDKHAAGYGRVSTQEQQKSGYSLDDQVRGMIRYFIKNRMAFRIFSDAGLSGRLPFYDKALIIRMLESKVAIYGDVFDSVLLAETRLERYTADEIKSIQKYKSIKIAKIWKSDPSRELDLRPRTKQATIYRPGLRLLLQSASKFHVVCISDLSRISRSQYLFSEIMRVLHTHSVRIEGLLERLDFLNDKRIGTGGFANEVQAFLLSKMAEFRIYEAMLGNVRGLLGRIESGKINGRPPSWLQVEDRGLPTENVVFKPGAKETIESLLRMYVDEGLNPTPIMRRLEKLGMKCPTELGVWTMDAFISIVENRAIVGYRCAFGREFPIFPPIIDETQWTRLQIRRATREIGQYVHNQDWQNKRMESPTKYLATGLIRCHCMGSHVNGRGGALCFQPSVARANSSGYVCGTARRKPEIKHIRLTDENVNEFIDSLMSTDPSVFLNQFQSNDEYKLMSAQLIKIDNDIVDLKAKLSQLIDEFIIQAREKVANVGLAPNEAGYDKVVEGFVDGMLAKDGIIAAVSSAETRRQHIVNSLNLYVPSTNHLGLHERISKWQSLEIHEKNRILLSLFERWQIRRNNDDDGDIDMIMILKNGQHLPPVKIQSLRKGATKIWRRLPSAEGWINQVIDDAQHNMQIAQT